MSDDPFEPGIVRGTPLTAVNSQAASIKRIADTFERLVTLIEANWAMEQARQQAAQDAIEKAVDDELRRAGFRDN